MADRQCLKGTGTGYADLLGLTEDEKCMTGYCHLLQLNLTCSAASSCVSVGLRQLLYQTSDVLNQLCLVLWARVCCSALHDLVGQLILKGVILYARYGL